ncbi:potassium channel protein [Photobacterium aquae]|uniref:Potassium channel protein n=1 Tax=Photobacterium aquae TaxID=1195763 RepID=A0A0J1GYC0_9GAMM|nr:potassium channel family protein [Photobacterium aquae]KLV04665.1 potassium channel protein [Photobacterium aquae]
MTLWMLLRRWAASQFHSLSGRNLLLLVIGYTVVSYILLLATGEQALTNTPTDFLYYLVVSASTVGYGDMSPTTAAGKWAIMLFVIPGGLGLFAITVGRVASVLIDYWKQGLIGKRTLSVKNHILVLGWNGPRTLHLIKMLQYEEKGRRDIVLCVRPEMNNPLPGEIEFVQVNTFTDSESMARAGVDTASCILIDNPEDDISLSAALFCAHRNPNAHLLAYFTDETLSSILKLHCPNAECIPSVAVEMLAKAAIDPGSSELHHELLSTHKGMTQYAVQYPHTALPTTVGALFPLFKQHHEAILIAIDCGNGVELNPSLNRDVPPGTKIFYISDERIDHFDWPRLTTTTTAS